MTSSSRLRSSICLIWLLCACVGYASEHPLVDENSRCLDCHADHAVGDHVHPAVKRGCTSCHPVENRDGVSYVALTAANPAVCFQCHQRSTYSDLHFPYASGMCTRCHNSHTSASPHLLKAKVNELCLSCHLEHRGSVPSQYLPTISLTSDHRLGHPYVRHPVSGARDPLTGDEMSCISCHLAHGGEKLHHLKMGSAIPEDALNQVTETDDMCHKCHMQLWGMDNTSGRKKKKAKAH
jgi:predicted CXXCH cytochrome family protein